KLLLTLSINLQILPASVLNYVIPLAIAPILASILLGGVPGILVGFWTSFALAAVLGNNFEVFVLGLMVSVTAVYTTRDVKRRTNLFRAGLWVGAIKIFFVLILAVLNQPSWGVIASQIAAAMLSGLACALMALLLIPVFEHVFNITTDIKLLELSDLSHPLLQSLAINAPGTYHHSLMMASLAQNAAEAIGANGLQLRVCAYFHDIGKLVKPGFFSENIQFTENPHDDLAPSMSTLVIVAHIKEGVTLAKKYKLPQVVIDGIEQHQGTSLVSVFYHRAKTQQQKETDGQPAINAEDFRYEGPKPQNREMAILMLADGCEAASRSLEKPTPVRINNLISDIFDARLRDGQLDECNLTLAELNTVKQAFVFSLTNMLHGRIAYPKDENAPARSSKQNPAQPASNPPADR
ncbi:MAG: HDIG domain-containing protein, partial [Verrucomicrobia bacterium]|nr:HDIG domain-containing protein [Verrucomicrobiota bacterium]